MPPPSPSPPAAIAAASSSSSSRKKGKQQNRVYAFTLSNEKYGDKKKPSSCVQYYSLDLSVCVCVSIRWFLTVYVYTLCTHFIKIQYDSHRIRTSMWGETKDEETQRELGARIAQGASVFMYACANDRERKKIQVYIIKAKEVQQQQRQWSNSLDSFSLTYTGPTHRHRQTHTWYKYAHTHQLASRMLSMKEREIRRARTSELL